MLKIILAVVIVLAGIGIGGGAGYLLRPPPPEPPPKCACEQGEEGETPADEGEAVALDEHGNPIEPVYEYVNLSNQFVIPIIENDAMTGMVVMSVSLEIDVGAKETVFAREPKLRDEFLRLLFAYSAIGGFGGNYLESSDLNVIRSDLTKAAERILGPIVHQALIVDMVRQDL